MAATLKDIVRQTGFSMSTVSNVLNGRPGFSPSTQERIHQAARELGYLPNHLSRALAGCRSMSIGLMGETLKTPIRLLRIRQIETMARKDNYHIYLVANEGMMAESNLEQTIDDLLARRVDGLIACELIQLPRPVVQKLLTCGKPVVFVDEVPPGAPFGIQVDHTTAMHQAVAHLKDLGHDSIVYMSCRFDQLVPELKLGRYRKGAELAGVELVENDDWYLEATGMVGDRPGSAYELTRQMLEVAVPSAIICVSDETAIGTCAAIRDAGLRVPEDVSVIGYDDLPTARFNAPSLTTISQPMEQTGQAAYALLSTLFAHPDTPPQIQQLRCRFIARNSTGPARADRLTAQQIRHCLSTRKPTRVV